MYETIKRVDLPSGGWWEIETRPRWRHLRECENDTERDTLEHILASLTMSWSFPDEISRASIKACSCDDLKAVLEVLNAELSQFTCEEDPKELSEELFAGLVAGQIPPQFIEIHIMAATGWSWETLQDTPADVVQKMIMYLSVRQARDAKGSLDFINDEGVHHAE